MARPRGVPVGRLGRDRGAGRRPARALGRAPDARSGGVRYGPVARANGVPAEGATGASRGDPSRGRARSIPGDRGRRNTAVARAHGPERRADRVGGATQARSRVRRAGAEGPVGQGADLARRDEDGLSGERPRGRERAEERACRRAHRGDLGGRDRDGRRPGEGARGARRRRHDRRVVERRGLERPWALACGKRRSRRG
jgi:hypothetical protein